MRKNEGHKGVQVSILGVQCTRNNVSIERMLVQSLRKVKAVWHSLQVFLLSATTCVQKLCFAAKLTKLWSRELQSTLACSQLLFNCIVDDALLALSASCCLDIVNYTHSQNAALPVNMSSPTMKYKPYE